MMSAPEKIFVTYEEQDPIFEGACRIFRCADFRARDSQPEYHLARPGQPCSTDEFLARVSGDYNIENHVKLGRIHRWVIGDFAAAMEGME